MIKGAKLSTSDVVLIPTAVAINLIGSFIAGMLKLPLYMDLVGTTMAGAIGGWYVALLVSIFSSTFQGLFVTPIYFPYMVVSIANALLIAHYAKAGCFKDFKKAITPWVAIVAASTVLSSIVTIYLFNGIPGATGSSLITATLMAAGSTILDSVVSSSFLVELLDKGIAVFGAVVVLQKIPERFIHVNRGKIEYADDDF